MQAPDRYRAATLIQAAFRGYKTRKRNAALDLVSPNDFKSNSFRMIKINWGQFIF